MEGLAFIKKPSVNIEQEFELIHVKHGVEFGKQSMHMHNHVLGILYYYEMELPLYFALVKFFWIVKYEILLYIG